MEEQTNPNSADHSDSTEEAGGNGPVQRLQAEYDALYERLARDTAEFRNAQKRLSAETEQRVQFANSSLIKSLLPVIDNFERALSVDATKADSATILKGMQIVHDEWLKVLHKAHVEPIAPEKGEAFDPTRHEALMQVDAEGLQSGQVVQTLQKGYALHGRTLRPAQVSVAR